VTKRQPLDNPAIALAAKRSKRRSTVPPRRAPMRQVSKCSDDDDNSDGAQLTKLPRLIFKKEVIELCGVTFPTIWRWMEDGTFPRSREVGSKTAWFEHEVADWLASRPLTRRKGEG
jgi:prophage regulatory protein